MMNYMTDVFGENLMDVFDDDFFRGFGGIDRALYGKHFDRLMKTDVNETENGYEVCVDLPGFDKNDIKLELDNGYLTISTQKSAEKKEERHGRVLRRERCTGTMRRSFYVGDAIKEEDVKASYNNGVLRLMVPKKEAEKLPEKQMIMIE